MPSIDPVRLEPPPPRSFQGPFAANDRLALAELWPTPGDGPEDIAFDSAGNLYAGLVDGRVVRFGPGGVGPETLFSTGGRPLGLEVDASDRLIICDAYKGLSRTEPATPEVVDDP